MTNLTRRRILELLLGGVGTDVWIEPPFFCDYGAHTYIGVQSFINANCVFLDSAEIRIGASVLIGPGVQLVTASHPLRASDRVVPVSDEQAATTPYRTQARPITIGDQVWLGAGSLVTADVPPHCLAFGQPCRVQRDL